MCFFVYRHSAATVQRTDGESQRPTEQPQKQRWGSGGKMCSHVIASVLCTNLLLPVFLSLRANVSLHTLVSLLCVFCGQLLLGLFHSFVGFVPIPTSCLNFDIVYICIFFSFLSVIFQLFLFVAFVVVFTCRKCLSLRVCGQFFFFVICSLHKWDVILHKSQFRMVLVNSSRTYLLFIFLTVLLQRKWWLLH